jgi:aspartokinase
MIPMLLLLQSKRSLLILTILAQIPNYDFVYDQGYGELISTTILTHFMNHMGINTQWIDVRNFIKPILITEMPQ